jgi:ATP-dependent DNA helicase RecG
MSKALQYLKGVGPVRVRQLERLDIFSVSDLIHHYPRDYHFRPLRSIRELANHPGETAIISGRILDTPREIKKRVRVLTATIADGSGFVKCTWFNQSFLKSKLQPGTELSVAGKLSREYGNIAVEDYSFDSTLPQIQPQYNLTEGLSNQAMAKMIINAMEDCHEEELYPQSFLDKNNLLSIKPALEQIHRPQSKDQLEHALYSIKFRELYLYQLSFLYWRSLKKKEIGYAHNLIPDLTVRMEKSLGFKFTPDQLQSIGEIGEDLARPIPMNRMLQGDVGSGKTAVAAFALITSALNGYKAAMMVPTEIVARQHYATMQQLTGGNFAFPVHLLTGSTRKSERESIQADLTAEGGGILIGTHAVFQESVHINGLALVITDEQHRFGVGQRLALSEKGQNPHVLVMSATPIPRTMAMTVYGDLDVSTIRTKPGGRRQIKTYVVHRQRRQKVFDFISKEMANKGVGYVVCPLIEESEKVNALSLGQYQEILEKGLPKWCKFGVLHGRMSGPAKDKIVQSLKTGEINLLLATTVVEVGVDVGDATFIVIENSERFGLAQLHQLRGRVGRREKQGYCFLISDGSETERLKILEQTDDGFAVAMADLKIRGSGQFLGQRQHGLNEFRLADVVKDSDIAKKSRAAAMETANDLDKPQWNQVFEKILQNIANLKS